MRVGSAARARSTLATALLGCAGLVALGAALVVRVHWHNPVMTVLGVILALALGISGLFYLLAAFWLLLTGPPPLARPRRGRRRPRQRRLASRRSNTAVPGRGRISRWAR